MDYKNGLGICNKVKNSINTIITRRVMIMKYLMVMFNIPKDVMVKMGMSDNVATIVQMLAYGCALGFNADGIMDLINTFIIR